MLKSTGTTSPPSPPRTSPASTRIKSPVQGRPLTENEKLYQVGKKRYQGIYDKVENNRGTEEDKKFIKYFMSSENYYERQNIITNLGKINEDSDPNLAVNTQPTGASAGGGGFAPQGAQPQQQAGAAAGGRASSIRLAAQQYLDTHDGSLAGLFDPENLS